MNPIFKLWSAWAVLALAGMYFFAFVPPVYAFSSAALSGGQCAVVMNANAQGGLAVRSEPGTAAGVLLRLSDGTRVNIIAGPQVKNGITWWQTDQGGWSAGLYLSEASCQTATPPPCTAGKNVDRGFMTDVARLIANPAIRESDLSLAADALAAWQAGENSSACWNPLGAVLDLPGATRFNSANVRNYPDRSSGVRATALALNNSANGSAYRAIRTALARQGFDASALRAALNSWTGSEPYAAALAARFKGVYFK